MTEKPDPRIPEIVRRRASGQSFTDMSDDMGVSRKTLYNLRSGDAYLKVVDDIFSSLMTEIEEMSNSDQHTVKMDALKEKGRILRALLPSLSVIQHRADPARHERETANEITEKRKRSEELIKALHLTPEQMRVFEANVIPEDGKK